MKLVGLNILLWFVFISCSTAQENRVAKNIDDLCKKSGNSYHHQEKKK